MLRSGRWLFILLALPLSGADFRFSGTVVDENNAPVVGATVAASPAKAGLSARHTVTDLKGAFHVQLPEAGNYSVEVDCEGYFRLAKKLELPGPQTTLVLNHARELYQALEVPAQLAAVDLDRTTREKRVSDLMIVAIPYPSTNSLRNAMRLVPGVSQDNKGGLHLDGGAEDQVLYTLDGFNVADPLTGRFESRMTVEAVRSIEVSSGRFSPEFGKGSAGAVAVKTVMGDDKFRYGATNFVPGVENHKGIGIGNWTPRLTFTGPLRRGRAWFSSSVDAQYDRNIVEELPKGQDTTTSLRGSATFRGQVNLTPGNILFTGLLMNAGNSPRTGLSILNPMETTTDRRSRQWFFHLKDQAYVGHNALVEMGYAANRTFGREIPQGRKFLNMTTEGWSGNSFIDATRRASRDQLLINAFLPPAGTHRIKVGADLDRLWYWQDVRRTGYDAYGAAGQLTRRVRFAGTGRFSRRDYEAAAYAQDSWKVRPNLVFDLGARFDRDWLISSHAVSPRLGMAWSPSGSSSLRISGGFGVIYDAVSLRLFTRPLDQYTLTTYYWQGQPVRGPAMATYYIDPDSPLRTPRYHNVTLGVERRLPGNFLARVDWLRKRGYDGFTYAGAPHTPPAIRAAFPDGLFDVVYQLANKRRDVVDSASITVRKSFRRQYEWMACYTRSRALSNAVVDVNIDDPLIVSSNVGPMPWDAPNRLQSWGYLPTPFKKWSVAYLLEWRNGYPFSIQDDSGAIQGDLNSWRFPAYFEADIHLERKLSLKGHFWAFRFGCNNVIGRRNPTVVNANTASPNFLTFYGGQGRTFNFRMRWLGKANR